MHDVTRYTNMNVYMWEKSGQNGQNKYGHSKIDLNLRFVPMDNPKISHRIINMELIYAFGVIFLIWKKELYHSKNNQDGITTWGSIIPIMHFESILNWSLKPEGDTIYSVSSRENDPKGINKYDIYDSMTYYWIIHWHKT